MHNRTTVAELLGVKHSQLAAWQKRGIIPAPSVQIGKRLFYTTEESDTVLRVGRERIDAWHTLRNKP